MNWTEEELAQMLKDNPELRIGGALPATLASTEEEVSKYHSRRTEYNRVWYHSKKEAQFAESLDLQKRAGKVNFWLRQVPFQLPGVVYRLDFLVAYPNGEYRLYDVKGWDTALSKAKRKMVEALYPVSIELI